MQYHIYHSTGDKRFTETAIQPRIYAGFVEADTLGHAYVKSQNFDKNWNPTNPQRSTSVGDVIQGEGTEGDGFYMVKGLGFKFLGVDTPSTEHIDNGVLALQEKQ